MTRLVIHNYLGRTRDAGRVTSTFGPRLAKAGEKAKANSEVSKEEWQRRYTAAEKAYNEANAEGERRKDSSGAYPKDVLRKRNAAIKEMDTARQYGGVRDAFWSGNQAMGAINNRARRLYENSTGYKEKWPRYNDWGYAPPSIRKEFSDEAVRLLKQEGKIDPNWPKKSGVS